MGNNSEQKLRDKLFGKIKDMKIDRLREISGNYRVILRNCQKKS